MEKNIWIIKLEGDMPSKDSIVLGRTSGLTRYLADQGYNIIWWKSSFHHGNHVDEYKSEREIDIIPGYKVVLLHSPITYKKNISLGRVMFCKLSARDFEKYSANLPKPDLILSSWPTLSLTEAALKYGKENDVPVLVDVRDRWPDVFERAFPTSLRKFGNIMLNSLRSKAAKLLSQADGLTADVYPELVWACKYAGRTPGEQDTPINIGKERVVLDEETMHDALKAWENLGVTGNTWNICFFSTLGSQLDLDTFIDAVRIVSAKHPDIKLVIGGRGDDESRLKNKYADMPNVIFAGYLDGVQMASMMSISKCGAYCLKNSFGFADAFSNKIVQYLSGGLPVLNSLQGFAKTVLADNNCGLSYNEGNSEECAEAIKYLYDHEAERTAMGKNAEKLFEEKYDLNVINKQFEEHMLYIIERHKRARK